MRLASKFIPKPFPINPPHIVVHHEQEWFGHLMLHILLHMHYTGWGVVFNKNVEIYTNCCTFWGN